MSTWGNTLRERFEALSEIELQHSVVEPLLEANGFQQVRDVSGQDREGRELIATKPEMGISHFYRIQIRKLHIGGKSEGVESMTGLLRDLDSAIQNEITDPLTRVNRLPDRLMLITPYSVDWPTLNAAIEYHKSTARSQITILDGSMLATEMLNRIPQAMGMFGDSVSYRMQLTSQHSVIMESRAFGIAEPLKLNQIFVEADYLCFDELQALLIGFLELDQVGSDGRPGSLRPELNREELEKLLKHEAQWRMIQTVASVSPDGYSVERFLRSLVAGAEALVKSVNEYRPVDGEDAINSIHKRIIAMQAMVAEVRKTVILRKASHLVSDDCRQVVAESIKTLGKNRRLLTYRHLYRSSSVLAISGVAGGGKSTLLKRLLTKALEEDLEREVVFARAIDLTDLTTQGVLRYLLTQRTLHGGDLKEEEFRENIAKGKVRIMIDGLDEAGTRAQKLASVLLEITRKYPATPMTVTARETVDLSDWKAAIHLRLCPFSDNQITEFISRWFAAKPTAREGLQDWLKRNPSMRETARTPLMAALLCSLYNVGPFMMPLSETDLLERRLDFLLGRWEEAKTITAMPEQVRDRYQLFLMHLAYGAHDKQERSFPQRTALDLSTRFMTPGFNANSGAILQDCLGRGLIMTDPNGDLSLGHLALQEFLVGKYLQQYNDLDDILTRLGVDWWRRPLSFYAALIGDISGLLKRLGPNGRSKHQRQLDELIRLTAISPPSHLT